MSPRAWRLVAPDSGEAVYDIGQWLFLDTETTGLAGGTGTYAFLVGFGWWEEERFVVEQFFMRNHGEEPSLLLDVLERLAERRVLVTFNGKSFDWPLLQTRFQMTRIGGGPGASGSSGFAPPCPPDLASASPLGGVDATEQHILQFDRGEDIPSATIPQRYFDFLRGGSPEAMVEVFHHNQMDLCGLAALALRIAGMLADPESSGCGAGELFGISRLLQRRGQETLAGSMYQKALDEGLPGTAEQTARKNWPSWRSADRLCAFKLAVGKASRRCGGRAEGL